jgi:hypothetical protein
MKLMDYIDSVGINLDAGKFMRKRHCFSTLVAFGAATTIAGCAVYGPTSNQAVAGRTPIPLVQNCAVIQTGTPSRFACNGKVYTSYQLAKLREDEAKRYASSK